jgi:hypothetical protein
VEGRECVRRVKLVVRKIGSGVGWWVEGGSSGEQLGETDLIGVEKGDEWRYQVHKNDVVSGGRKME